jgi:hypothetical protein
LRIRAVRRDLLQRLIVGVVDRLVNRLIDLRQLLLGLLAFVELFLAPVGDDLYYLSISGGFVKGFFD